MMMAYPSQTIFIAMNGNGNIMYVYVCVNAVCAVLIPYFSALFHPSKMRKNEHINPHFMRHLCVLKLKTYIYCIEVHLVNKTQNSLYKLFFW